MADGTMGRGASFSSLQMRRSQHRFSPFSVFGKTVLCKEKKGDNGVFVREQDYRLRCNPSHAAPSHTHACAHTHITAKPKYRCLCKKLQEKLQQKQEHFQCSVIHKQ